MMKQMNSEILDALLKAANAAEQAGDFRLADRTDELAQRVAQTPLQMVKNIAKPALTYMGNDQLISPTITGLTNAVEGKALGTNVFDNAPSSMIGIGGGNYIGTLIDPLNWAPDAVMALNKTRFMNMLRSQLITAGYTELADDNLWKAFSAAKEQGGLEDLLRQTDPVAARKFLGEQKATPKGFADFFTRFRERAIANKGTHWARFKARYFTSALKGGSYNLSADRAKRVNDFIKNKSLQNADKGLSTEELIKKYRLSVDDVEGFDRSKVKTKAPKAPKSIRTRIPSAIKDINSVTGKATSAEAMVQSVANHLKSNPSMMEKFLARAGKTEEGAKWLATLRATKDTSKIATGLKVLGKIAVFFAVLDIVNTLPAAMQGDTRAQVDVVINTAGMFFPPLAIANALAGLFGIDLSDMLVTSTEALGEMLSGVDMDATREGLINTGMIYNQKTKEWEDGGGYALSFNEKTGKSFQADMMNMVKAGMSINQAWMITLKNMKAAGSTPEEILAVRQKYNQAKTMIYNEGMIGYMKAPVWSAEQITNFEQSLNKHLVAKLQSGVPYSDLLREIDSYMLKVPNLHMINAIRSRIVDNLNAAQKSIEQGEKPVAIQGKQNTTTQRQVVDNSLMSTEQRSRGARVAAWQQFLAQNGFFPGYNQKTPPVFGPRTTRGTRAFQSKYNLRVDGVVGPETLGKARQLGGKL
jgi:Mor family transcriptional regulator